MVYRWKSDPSLGGLPENTEQDKAGVLQSTFKGIKDLWNKPLVSIGFDKTESGIPYIRFRKSSK